MAMSEVSVMSEVGASGSGYDNKVASARVCLVASNAVSALDDQVSVSWAELGSEGHEMAARALRTGEEIDGKS